MFRCPQIRRHALGLTRPQELLVSPTTPLPANNSGREIHEKMQRPNGVRSLGFLSFISHTGLVLETMQGDSLSKENIEAYIGLLNVSGAFSDSK